MMNQSIKYTSKYKITHKSNFVGASLQDELYFANTPEEVWKTIVSFVKQKIELLSLWPVLLDDAINAGLNSDLTLEDGITAADVSYNDDQYECKLYCLSLLNEHNIVGWWMNYGLTGVGIKVCDAKNKNIHPLTITDPVCILPPGELEALFY